MTKRKTATTVIPPQVGDVVFYVAILEPGTNPVDLDGEITAVRDDGSVDLLVQTASGPAIARNVLPGDGHGGWHR